MTGHELARLRETMGVSQRYLARQLRARRETVAQHEQNAAPVPDGWLRRVLRVLGDVHSRRDAALKPVLGTILAPNAAEGRQTATPRGSLASEG